MGIKDISRGKTIIYFVIPYILAIGLYYHFGDELRARTVSWQSVMNNNELVEIDALSARQFGEINVEQNMNISSNTLDSLLSEWGIDVRGMEGNENKITLLLKVSNPDFWRLNFEIHPKMHRIQAWKSNHRSYLSKIKKIRALEGKSKYQLLSKFTAFSNKIEIHSEFEETVLYKFFAENLFDLGMDGEYADIHGIANTIKRDLEWIHDVNSEECNDIDALLEQYEQKLTAHFTTIEQKIVAPMLNMDNALYRKYRYYLGWNYYLMY